MNILAVLTILISLAMLYPTASYAKEVWQNSQIDKGWSKLTGVAFAALFGFYTVMLAVGAVLVAILLFT